MTMTVSELIADLQSRDPNAEVRLMFQPDYPFEHSVNGVWTPGEQPDPLCVDCDRAKDETSMHEEGNDDYHEYVATEGFEPDGKPANGVVYIVERSQLGYGSADAWS